MEVGDVRAIFSETEILALAAGEEEHHRRSVALSVRDYPPRAMDGGDLGGAVTGGGSASVSPSGGELEGMGDSRGGHQRIGGSSDIQVAGASDAGTEL